MAKAAAIPAVNESPAPALSNASSATVNNGDGANTHARPLGSGAGLSSGAAVAVIDV